MISISRGISSIINGKRDVCCLCLNGVQDKPLRLTDEVVFNVNNKECDSTVEEVISFVFSEKMCSYINSINTICKECTKLAVNYYKFVQTSIRNAEYLEKILYEIANSIDYATDDYKGSKSLYVSFNLQDCTSKHYYDIKRSPTNARVALKRFRNLDKIQDVQQENLLSNIIKKEIETTDQRAEIKKKTKNNINISTEDMLDKNNPEIFKCKECLKEFPTIWNLRHHYIRIHAPKIFKCKDCSRTYGSHAFLEAHRNQSHCTFICSECGKTFFNRHTLKVHEQGHKLTLVCQDCGRVYKNKNTFKKHKEQNVCGQKTRAHPSEAKFTCDYCNKRYTQKMSLRVHIQYEHGNYKSHVCEWCGKKFWAQSRLKAHIVKHTREKNFPCTMCGGKFVTKESLLYHTRTHTGEKPYKCPHCEYRFLSASRRSDHVKRHHLGGMLQCDICHSKFTARSFLLKHKKTHVKISDKPNLVYDTTKNNPSKPKTKLQTKRELLKLKLNSDITSRDEWKIEGLDDVGIQSFQNVIESADVQIQNFGSEIYEDNSQQSSEDCKVYLEVSDDNYDFLKLAGIGT